MSDDALFSVSEALPDPGYPIDECRSCSAPIVWAVTEKRQRPAPFDARPAEDGNTLLSWAAGRAEIRARILPLPQRRGRYDLYRSHFATCPQADQHRKGRAIQTGPAAAPVVNAR